MRANLYPVRGLVLKAVGFDCVGGREGGASNGVSPITDAPLTLGVWTPPLPLEGGGGRLFHWRVVVAPVPPLPYSGEGQGSGDFFKSHFLKVAFLGFSLISFFGNWEIQIW